MLALIVLALLAADPVPTPPDLLPPVRGPVVRHFEPPPTPYAAGHRGIDLAAPEGAPVGAAAAGTVTFAGRIGSDLFVTVDHGEGYRTTYSYLGSLAVGRGAAVAQGQQVGAAGPGPHGGPSGVHLGLRFGQEYLDPGPALVAGLRANRWRVIGLAEAS